MKKTFLFFFLLSGAMLFIASTTFAQSVSGSLHLDNGKHGSIHIDGDTITISGSTNGTVKIDPKSLLRGWLKNRVNPDAMPNYRSDPDKHYYLHVEPSSPKGKRLDHSNVWLLKQELAQTCP